MSEAKPTPGPWSVLEHSWCETSIRAPSTDHALCRLDINHATEESQEADEAQMAANARLIAEAGTVFHNTGLSPVQLVERVKELEDALIRAKEAINSMKVEAETAAQGDEQMMLEACETISNEGLDADMEIRDTLSKALPSAAAKESGK